MEQAACIRGSKKKIFHHFKWNTIDPLGRVGDHFTWDYGLLSANDTPYVLDELGSPVRFGDEPYVFDEFGNGLNEHTSSQPFGFTGYQIDDVSGTFYSDRNFSDDSVLMLD